MRTSQLVAASNNSLGPSTSPTSRGSLALLKEPSIDFRKFFWSDRQFLDATLQPVSELPVDIWRAIAGLLDISSVFKLSRVCQGLLGLRTDMQVLKIQYENHLADLEDVVFGKKAWNTYFGDVGEVDPIPELLIKALEQPCPFWPDKKVKETHIACWIPEKVNGIDLNLNSIGEFIKKPLHGHAGDYSRVSLPKIAEYGSATVKKGHWILLTKNIIKGSKNKSQEEQKKFLKAYPGYEMPIMLSTVIALLIHHAKTGKYFYSVEWDFTRCQEKNRGESWAVAGIENEGIYIYTYRDTEGDPGVGGLRNFIRD